MLPPEILTRILTVADVRSVASMRLTCRTIRRLIDNDPRFPYHVSKLRHAMSRCSGSAEAVTTLRESALVIRAALPRTLPFVIRIFNSGADMEPSVRDLDKTVGRLLEIHAYFSAGIDALGGLVSVEALVLNNSHLDSVPYFPRLTKLTISLSSTVTRLPTGLQTLVLENGGNVLNWTDEACATIRHLEVEDDFFTAGIFERHKFPLLETLRIGVDFTGDLFPYMRWPPNLRNVTM